MNFVKSSLLSLLAFSFTNALHAAPQPSNWAPIGWAQNQITMGTLYDNSPAANAALQNRPLTVIFNYTGQDGAGDRGSVVQPTKIINTMGDVKASKYQITPLFVIYTANASGGGTGQAFQDITHYEYLLDHYQTFILAIRQLETYAKANVMPITATVLLNPDFIGHLHQENSDPNASMTIEDSHGNTYSLQQALQAALNQLDIKNVTVPTQFAGIVTLKKYIQSINWLMGEFGPALPYGWQDNDWAGTTEGNLWFHMDDLNASQINTQIQQNATSEIDYLKALGVFNAFPLANGKHTAPSFIAFDKYGANPIFNGNYTFINQGYLFNNDDWFNYINYVTSVGKGLGDLPIMLWQMPGAHLPSKVDDTPFQNLATLPDFLFGDAQVNMDAFKNIPGQINPHTYTVTTTLSPGQYLQIHKQGNGETLWQSNHLALLKQDHIFAVLWGGGGYATGVIPQAAGFDDQGWLYNKIHDAYNTGLVAQPSLKPIPDPSKLPTYPNDEPYQTGDYVLGLDSKEYQCKVAAWCNGSSSSPYAPGGTGPWTMAWNKID